MPICVFIVVTYAYNHSKVPKAEVRSYLLQHLHYLETKLDVSFFFLKNNLFLNER